jgi:uncharacterized protein (DUF2126 family)
VSASVDAFVDAVETALREQEMTLTMGGEPTFIPAQPEAPEWNNQALGPEKLGYARRLAARLLKEMYPGGLVMQVYGKQYPGEPLPRWVVLTLHREDGVPLWHRPEMLLLNDQPGASTERDARKLVAALATELGLKRFVLPCVEEGGSADSPRGWVLPLDRVKGDWVSDEWPYSRDEPITLTEGQSPVGLRLPLGELDERHLRRALSVELSEGALQVFIPPLEYDAFSALTRAIERAAAKRGAKDLVLCGYRPSAASGVTALGLAADPGVLEVNLPPTRAWRDYDTVLSKVTKAAEAEGLYTTRLHLNGQVQGTGGGAHVLFGGPSVDDNPFFERPSLLSSIIRYWQRHPALSYFFSGQYVGPGSQAPRADETLMAKLYELETACFGADEADGTADRGFLDRVFRNLLTDSAGNTHLAEISIDKLWNYDSPTGLQGLIELRAFETLPELAHQSFSALFVRAVVAMLARTPSEGPLVRHGACLHDRYMLPAGLWEDLALICADLRLAGLPIDEDWLRPIFESRFPILGRFELRKGEVVVRQALEPWPLMAEISDGGSTSRMVDNSTDRLEVSLRGEAALDGGQVLADGVALVFRELGGVLAAGVRYKAASGWPALHPHVPIQSPLRLDVVDEGGRVSAAAHYHFWNPDGPRYEGRPADRAEALARRAARWRPLEEAAGALRAARPGRYCEESHFTLDLRRHAVAAD